MNIPKKKKNDDTCYDVIKNCYNDKYTKKKKKIKNSGFLRFYHYKK